MNGLDDLRRALDHQADGLVDHDLGGRAGSVHRRVGVVRRRRRAGAVAGLAAAVAVAAGTTLTLGNGQDDGRTQLASVVGVPAPDHLDSLGYTYRFEQGVNGQDGKAVLKLDAADQPRLVSWATSGDDQSVTVDGPSLADPTRFDGADFGDFIYVAPGDAYTVKVTAGHGEPGLALYTLGAERPAGVTQDGITYRKDVAGGTLLGATIGTLGQNDIAVPATASGPGASFRYFCAGGPSNAYLHVDYVDKKKGGFEEGGGCDDQLPVDAAIGASDTGAPTTAGEDVGLRFFVTAGLHGPMIDDPDLRIGLGIYALDQDPVGPDEFIPATLEDGGHVWRRVDVVRSGPAQRQIVTTAPAGRGPVLVVLFGGGSAGGDQMISATLDGSPGTGIGGGGATQQVMAGGGTATAQVDSAPDVPTKTFGMAFYVEAD